MTEPVDRQILQRMIESGRRVTRELTVDAAISLAVTRAGLEVLGLNIEARSVSERRMTLADLPEVIEDRALRLVIEGPEGGLGLMVLGVEVLSAVVQMQTIGRLCRTDSEGRRPTRTDAAMSVEFVDGILAGIEAEIAGTEAAEWGAGFRYASCIEEGRPLSTLLEDTGLRVWTITGRIGTGELTGQMLWVVPADGRGGRTRQAASSGAPRLGQDPGEAGLGPDDDDWRNRLEASVLGVEAHLDAVMHRMVLPLSAVMGFHPGLEIPLPAEALGGIVLEAGDRRLAVGRLGQFKGQRAVLLGQEADTRGADSGANVARQAGEDAGFSSAMSLTPASGEAAAPMSPDIDILLGTVAAPFQALG